MTVKEQLKKLVDSLPDDARIEDAMEKIYFLYKVQRGTEQLDAGQRITHDEARKRMARWLS